MKIASTTRSGTSGGAVPGPDVSIVLADSAAADPVARHAAREIEAHFLLTAGAAAGRAGAVARIRLAIDPDAVGNPAPESFRIAAARDGLLSIVGADGPGLLWGVRDVQHYYAAAWIEGIAAGRPLEMDVVSSPTIQNRGLWTWQHGCYDPFAYVDRASEWKLNTVIFWNRGAPMDADRLAAYARERGVRIWWGFSWGWLADDFRDASPDLARRLLDLYEKQKREINPNLKNLDLTAPETPGALRDYVLDVFEKQYAWIPDLDGIYFQSATEEINPSLSEKTDELGRALARNIIPIMEEIHRRHPRLVISCGIHNSGTFETYEPLRDIPPYANILWEAGIHWASSRDIARRQMALRGLHEDFAGVYRITMHCNMMFRNLEVQGESPRAWLPRVERLWAYLEEGRCEPPGAPKWPFHADGKAVGYPCPIDWRPPDGGRLVDNPNLRELLVWSGDMATGPAQVKGIFLLVEAGLIDLKMRRVPAIAAETIWNPLADERELERRCRMIWERRVGGWREPANPFWRMPGRTQDDPQGGAAQSENKDLGSMYEPARP